MDSPARGLESGKAAGADSRASFSTDLQNRDGEGHGALSVVLTTACWARDSEDGTVWR